MKKVFEKTISDTGIVFISILFVIVSVYALFFIVGTELDPNRDKNWWSITFENRSLETSGFIIENHSDSDTFRYEITADGKTVETDTARILKGESQTINTDIPYEKTIEITATDQDGKKQSLYKKK